jgi:hypothetical protein
LFKSEKYKNSLAFNIGIASLQILSILGLFLAATFDYEKMDLILMLVIILDFFLMIFALLYEICVGIVPNESENIIKNKSDVSKLVKQALVKIIKKNNKKKQENKQTSGFESLKDDSEFPFLSDDGDNYEGVRQRKWKTSNIFDV